MKDILITWAKGLWIGGTLTVPGVSGGSMAMILGIYDRLLWAVNSFVKKGGEKKKAFFFLLWTAIGGGIGFVAFSALVKYLLQAAPLYVCCFFVGAVVGGVPLVLKKANIKSPSFFDVIMVLLGCAAVLLIALIPKELFAINGIGGIGGIGLKLLCGFILAFGLVLPGISFSQMMYVFGIYNDVVDRVSSFDILPLVPIGIGGVIGILATSLAVEKLMKKYPRRVYAIIFGFLLGSVPLMFTETLRGVGAVDLPIFGYPALIILAALGFAAVFFMSKKEENRELS